MNGHDKNWGRVCCAIEGFRSVFRRWPTRVRLYAAALKEIRDYILTPEAFAHVTSFIEFVQEEGAEMIAEDGTGAQFNYGKQYPVQKPPDITVWEWLGELAYRPHGESSLEAAINLSMAPNYLGSEEVVSNLVRDFIAAIVEYHAERICHIFSGKDPAFTIMPGWHNDLALGQAMVGAFNMDPEYYKDESLIGVLSEGFWGLSGHLRRFIKEFQKTEFADWERHALPQLLDLHRFVTALLMGTNEVFYPGKTLKDFGWNPPVR